MDEIGIIKLFVRNKVVNRKIEAFVDQKKIYVSTFFLPFRFRLKARFGNQKKDQILFYTGNNICYNRAIITELQYLNDIIRS
jgi:hypothetical protein